MCGNEEFLVQVLAKILWMCLHLSSCNSLVPFVESWGLLDYIHRNVSLSILVHILSCITVVDQKGTFDS